MHLRHGFPRPRLSVSGFLDAGDVMKSGAIFDADLHGLHMRNGVEGYLSKRVGNELALKATTFTANIPKKLQCSKISDVDLKFQPQSTLLSAFFTYCCIAYIRPVYTVSMSA